MDDDVGIRKLVELIFVKKFQVTAEMTAQNSSFPTCLITNDFPQKLRCVLMIRQAIVHDIYRKAWPQFFVTYISNTQTSLEDYVKSVLSACVIENTCLNKAFDSFISVCSLVRVFGLQITQKTGMNFCDFNTDMVLEFYECVLKNSFVRCGGLQRFVGYIHQHKYLNWNMDMNDQALLDDPSAHVNNCTTEKLEKEKMKESNARNKGFTRHISVNKLDSLSKSMAEKIFSTTTVKLSPVTCSQDPNRTDVAMNLNEKTKSAERTMEVEAALKSEPLDETPRCLSLNSDSEVNHAAKQKEVIPGYQSIVKAIIKHNHFKSSDLANGDNQLLEKANRILDHLKDTIKSLIEVLDEYDKE